MRPSAPHARGRILGKPVSVHSMFSHLQPGDGLGERPAHTARSRDDAVLDRVAAIDLPRRRPGIRRRESEPL